MSDHKEFPDCDRFLVKELEKDWQKKYFGHLPSNFSAAHCVFPFSFLQVLFKFCPRLYLKKSQVMPKVSTSQRLRYLQSFKYSGSATFLW